MYNQKGIKLNIKKDERKWKQEGSQKSVGGPSNKRYEKIENCKLEGRNAEQGEMDT